MLAGLAQSVLFLSACFALGFALEEAASLGLVGLHLVPLGPSPLAADVDLDEPVAKPFGEHGWIPIPLGLLDIALVLMSGYPNSIWRDDSWWGSCAGPVWGQLPTLAICTFTITPAVLAAWLLWMPWQCSPLSVTLATVVFTLGIASTLFWSDALPILPRAHAEADAARRGVQRSLLYALHPPLYAACLHLLWDHHGDATAHPGAGCSALLAQLQAKPAAFGATLAEQLRAQTPQGQSSPLQLALQLCVLVLCLHICIDVPRPASTGKKAKEA